MIIIIIIINNNNNNGGWFGVDDFYFFPQPVSLSLLLSLLLFAVYPLSPSLPLSP